MKTPQKFANTFLENINNGVFDIFLSSQLNQLKKKKKERKRKKKEKKKKKKVT